VSSPFAVDFETRARPLLWARLSELVTYREGEQVRSLRVMFRRADPRRREAEGPEGFHAGAWAVAKVADLPTPSGRALLVRDGVTWAIRLIERQDPWTWILHLAQPTEDLRLPDRIR
jgi:hypothetical protein